MKRYYGNNRDRPQAIDIRSVRNQNASPTHPWVMSLWGQSRFCVNGFNRNYENIITSLQEYH